MFTFENALAALARDGVAFVVVGGLAVARAGFVRVTDGVDLLVEPSEPNLVRLIAALSRFGDGAAAELAPDDFPIEEGCVRIAEDIDIDVFTVMSSQSYADLLPLTASHEVEGESVLFLAAEGLIRLKDSSLRPKDQIDAHALRQIQAGRNPND